MKRLALGFALALMCACGGDDGGGGSPDAATSGPDAAPLEVASVFRGLVRAGEVDAAEVPQFFTDLANLGVELYEHLPLLGRVFDLRANATVYDAVYLALAEALDASVLTCDGKLAGIAGGRAQVVAV